MAAAIQAMEEAFLALASGRATLPQRTAIRMAEREAVSLFMPGRVEGSLGAKIVSVFPSNAGRGLPIVSGIVVLLHAETGYPMALLEGETLTAIRTGAASALATRALADPDAGRLAIIGAGRQARTQLQAVCTVRPIKNVTLYSRTRERAERLASELAGVGGVPASIEVTDAAAAAVRDAEVVCVATSSSTPVLRKGEIAEGVHVNAIGSFRADMVELDPGLVAACRVVVDRREAALAEAGEVIAAIEGGLMRESDLVELGDVLAGRASVRESDRRPTLFKSVGLAVQDVCAAAAALRAAERDGLGLEVEW